MLLRVVPEEGQNVLPEDSTPWAKELPSSTSHSNRSLRTEVSVAGKRNFQRGDKEAETTLEIQGRRCRDKITLGNSANSGLIARFREISVRTRVRGGAGRTRTPNQAVMKQVALRTIRDKISASKRKGLWVGGIARAKSLSMSRGGPGTAALLSRGEIPTGLITSRD